MLYYELDHFFNVKKYLGVANMFCSTEKLNCIGVDLIWYGQLDKFKNNPRWSLKTYIDYNFFKALSFFKYWDENILDQPMSTQVNLSKLRLRSGDYNNFIESK
jgi:hypothetical protein